MELQTAPNQSLPLYETLELLSKSDGFLDVKENEQNGSLEVFELSVPELMEQDLALVIITEKRQPEGEDLPEPLEYLKRLNVAILAAYLIEL
jgi:hypothetical protein